MALTDAPTSSSGTWQAAGAQGQSAQGCSPQQRSPSRHAQHVFSEPCLPSCLATVRWAGSGFALSLHIVHSSKPAQYRGVETVPSFLVYFAK